MPGSFGIDFGTTNTRIAFFDGRQPIVVPVRDKRGTAYQIPSVVGYRDGKPPLFGYDALDEAHRDDSVTLCTSIKWLDKPVPIDGHEKQPTEIKRDFFGYVRQVVREARLTERSLDRASVTVPVNYPYLARQDLLQAMQGAGIEVTAVYQEPVAALYYDVYSRRTPGYAAVFDWGGGTLDIAVAELDAGRAEVRAIEGLRRGGDDFDKIILNNALTDFARQYPDLPLRASQLLEHPQRGTELRLLAEEAKKKLSSTTEAQLSRARLAGEHRHLDFLLRRSEFESWITPDVDRAIAQLESAARSAGVSLGILNPVLLCGGTSNIPSVQTRLKTVLHPEHVASTLRTTPAPSPGTPERDISNATAIGAAMLSVWGARAVFARYIGIRLATTESVADRFYPVFNRGDELKGEKQVPVFVTDASSGVARVLVCDRFDPILEPSGKLLRILTVPIAKEERVVNLSFSVDQHLMLKVRASGRVVTSRRDEAECLIPNIAVGFEIPPVGTAM